MRPLRGTAACAGNGPVQGIAVVAHNAQEAEERLEAIGGGRPVVLVCTTFSPRLEISLPFQVRGIVIQGSPQLSGATTVGRGLGLPVVAGLGAAIEAIPDGRAIYVDGEAGTVEVIG